jgi:hypothetical protein
MGRAERYREHGEECLAFSKSVDDPIWQAQLVAMAAQWRELADREFEIARRSTGRAERMNSPVATRA